MPLPAIGQTLRICKVDDESVDFKSTLLDLTPEYIRIEAPHRADSDDADKYADDMASAFIVEFASRDGALCRFRSRRLEDGGADFGQTWMIPVPAANEISREQRREYVRVPSDLPVHVGVVTTGGMNRYELYAQDVSGGGLSLRLPPDLYVNVGDVAKLSFRLPGDSVDINVDCVVVRIQPRNDENYATVSFRFTNISEKTRQRIIQYTFSRQRQIAEL